MADFISDLGLMWISGFCALVSVLGASFAHRSLKRALSIEDSIYRKVDEFLEGEKP